MKISSAAIVALFLIAGVALFKLFSGADKPAEIGSITTQQEAVKIIEKPVDPSGKWESATSKAGTKMVAEVKNNTIHVEMYAADGYTGLWYGTLDFFQPGQNGQTSKAIDDPDHFVLSSAETKEFIYQDDTLVFDFSVMGTRTTVAMKRV